MFLNNNIINSIYLNINKYVVIRINKYIIGFGFKSKIN